MEILLLMAEIRRSPVEVGSLSHCFWGFIHSRWCGISSINRKSVLLFFAWKAEHNQEKVMTSEANSATKIDQEIGGFLHG